MEKILNYEDRQVRFKSTAALPLRYKAQFGRDLFADSAVVQNSWHGDEEGNGYFDETLDMSLIYNVVWAMAKTADMSIKPPIEWFDEFENGLPIFTWFAELSELLTQSLSGQRKN